MSSWAGLQTGLAWLGPPQLGLWLCLARGDPGKLCDSAWMLLVFYLSEIMQDVPVGRRLATSGLLCDSPPNAYRRKAYRAYTSRPGLFGQATGNPDSERSPHIRGQQGCLRQQRAQDRRNTQWTKDCTPLASPTPKVSFGSSAFSIPAASCASSSLLRLGYLLGGTVRKTMYSQYTLTALFHA
jgi:hypothetical protein